MAVPLFLNPGLQTGASDAIVRVRHGAANITLGELGELGDVPGREVVPRAEGVLGDLRTDAVAGDGREIERHPLTLLRDPRS